MGHTLLLVATVLGLFALVPLATWAATGRLKDAWRAGSEYLAIMAILVLPGLAVGTIVGLLGWLVP